MYIYIPMNIHKFLEYVNEYMYIRRDVYIWTSKYIYIYIFMCVDFDNVAVSVDMELQIMSASLIKISYMDTRLDGQSPEIDGTYICICIYDKWMEIYIHVYFFIKIYSTF
jgi:hypothetical protein